MRLRLLDRKAIAVDLIESGIEPSAVNTRQLQLRHDVVMRSADSAVLAVGNDPLDVVLQTCHVTSGL